MPGQRPSPALSGPSGRRWTGLAAKSQLDRVPTVIRNPAATSFAVRNAGPS